MDPVQATLANITDFLADQFLLGLEYSTMNVYRSALSAYHPKINGYSVGQHPEVTRLLAGMFNQKPPIPRYVETWDVNAVLGTIKAMGDNTYLNDKDLTQKLAMLLALTNVTRAQELQSINPQMMEDFSDRVVFHIARL